MNLFRADRNRMILFSPGIVTHGARLCLSRTMLQFVSGLAFCIVCGLE